MPSYYRIIKGIRYDRSLLELAQSLTAGKGDGRLSEKDVQELIKSASDANKLTKVEQRTLAYINTHFRLTSSGEQELAPWIINAGKESYLDQAEALLRQFKVNGTVVVIDEEEAQRQEKIARSVSFTAAFRECLFLLFHEPTGGRTTPWMVIQNIYGYFPEQDKDAEDMIRKRLLEHLRTSEIQLIPAYDPEDENLEFNPPADGETVADNWIFSIYLEQLSDHSFWAVIPRTADGAAYIYGLN